MTVIGKNYFLHLCDSDFTNGLTKQEKFLSDLNLNKKRKGFAIVPIKFNRHFVTLIINLQPKPKEIMLFDSSLLFMNAEDENSVMFNDFILNEGKKEYEDVLLSKNDYQGNLIEDIDDEITDECYEMEICGFWTSILY